MMNTSDLPRFVRGKEHLPNVWWDPETCLAFASTVLTLLRTHMRPGARCVLRYCAEERAVRLLEMPSTCAACAREGDDAACPVRGRGGVGSAEGVRGGGQSVEGKEGNGGIDGIGGKEADICTCSGDAAEIVPRGVRKALVEMIWPIKH